jgi:hypothetical protein
VEVTVRLIARILSKAESDQAAQIDAIGIHQT